MDYLNDTIFPITIEVLAFLYLYIAVRGFVKRKPFLMPSRWFFVFIVLIFIPSLTLPWELNNRPTGFGLLTWVSPLFSLIFLWFFWKAFNGYTVYGVTDESFRKSLLSAIKKSKLKYKENLSGIYLETYKTTLKASLFWMGTGQILVKGKIPRKLLRSVIRKMDEELSKPGSNVDLKPFWFYLVVGGIFLILGFFAISLFRQMG